MEFGKRHYTTVTTDFCLNASDSVVFLRHCALYKFTYLLTYLQTCCGIVVYVADLLATTGKLPTCYALATGKLP